MFKPLRCLASAPIWMVIEQERPAPRTSTSLYPSWEKAEAKQASNVKNGVRSRIEILPFPQWDPKLRTEVAGYWRSFPIWGVQEREVLASGRVMWGWVEIKQTLGEATNSVVALMKGEERRLFRVSFKRQAMWRPELHRVVQLARSRFERV